MYAEKMLLSEYITEIENRGLSASQKENVEKVVTLSEKFHRDAGIEAGQRRVDERTVVIESGHQPNFLPHAGTWKKAFLGDYLSKKIEGAIFLFGFADQNLSTAQILSQSRVPAATKTGSLSIGFKIPEKERWKTFDSISKPAPEEFEEEIARLKGHYPEGLGEMEALMRKSYERAKNLADMNSFIYANLCSAWGLSAHFFRYSDVQKAALFPEGYEKLLSLLPRYNSIYNRVLAEEKIEDMRPLDMDSAPFWLHCPCGGKVQMRLAGGVLFGKCTCGKEHEFAVEQAARHIHEMSPAAVSRNIVFAQGLGTSVFLSGAGGGLRYGRISDAISKEMGLALPATIAWKGRDYYLGKTHKAVLKDLARNAGIDSFVDMEAVRARIEGRKKELAEAIKSSQDKKELQKYQGQAKTLEVQLAMAEEVFSLVPSFLDELVSLGSPVVLQAWERMLAGAHVENADDAYLISRDTVFDAEADKTYAVLAGL